MENVRRRDPDNVEEALAAMKLASYEDWTLWTVIFDRENLEATWYFRSDWEAPVKFEL